MAKRTSLLANVVEFVTFIATPPEANAASVLNGPGMAPMLQTAVAYASMAGALGTAADNLDGSTTVLSAAWPSGIQPQERFRLHAGWLREQAAVAAQAAKAAEEAASAYQAAQASMVEISAELIVNHVTQAALLATNMGQNAIPLALNEAHYGALWARAASTMMIYAGATSTALQSISSPQPAPSITSPGGAAQSLPAVLADLARSGGATTSVVPVGNPIGGAMTGVATPMPAAPTSAPAPLPTSGPTSVAQPGSQLPSTGAVDPGSQTEPQAAQGPSDQQAPADAGANESSDGQGSHQGFFGTSPSSSTLAGLNGGVGSSVALGMSRGGLASVSGASNGFRMPANWARRPGGVFGAAAGEPEPAPVVRGPASGTSAPDMLRRRRNGDNKRPSKVYVPGAPEEIPTFESQPVIGVIEYEDAESYETSSANI
ncbi:PPE family protein [Nocardia sp.]|uniref:PPE family protein n=1 Tax=Nocardia sp. TaxID=1821 RepID=UPI00263360C9|nr:PPE domain-containing protein [Nocardia sp.]